MVPGWPVLETDNDLSSKAATGRQVRVAGSRYTLRRVGTEVQTVTLVTDPNVANFWKLSLAHSGVTNEMSLCLPFDATGDDVDAELGSLAVVNGDVVVTRRGSGTHGDPYVHSIYFEGENTAGDVNEVNAGRIMLGIVYLPVFLQSIWRVRLSYVYPWDLSHPQSSIHFYTAVGCRIVVRHRF